MTLSTKEVAAAAQVSLRQLQWWHEQGIVAPSYTNKNERSWDSADLFRTLLVARLRSKGISIQRVRELLKAIPMRKMMEGYGSILMIRSNRLKSVTICYEDQISRWMDLENGPVCIVCIAPLLEILKREDRKLHSN